MSRPLIRFNQMYYTGFEEKSINQAMASRILAGDGPLTTQCSDWLKNHTDSQGALLTHSCTAALEMAAMLIDLKPGDEVIMPSYTFVSTANAVALRGAIPVFVDVRPDTLNLDESLIENAITSQTRAIWPVHYAGVACEMDDILAIAKKHNLKVVEDAAQAINATYKGLPLGGLGDLSAFSFHESKNIVSGEGGSLHINNPDFIDAAEVIREKGTDRTRFLRGEVDKYSWRSLGSSYLPSELIAAFLFPQLKAVGEITSKRMAIWDRYHEGLEKLEQQGFLSRQFIPEYAQHNAHLFYVLLNRSISREDVIARMAEHSIQVYSHYVPLHDSPAGMMLGRSSGKLTNTEKLSPQLLRLPIWPDLQEDAQDHVIKSLHDVLNR